MELYKKSYTKTELRDMLYNVVDVLNLSEACIEEHGPRGTPPAELVRQVLEEKDKQICMLRQGFKEIH